MEPVQFETMDNILLSGSLFNHENPEGVTIIHGATGVPVGYYSAFAEWYCQSIHHHVLIYAYRDSQDMDRAALRKSKTTMADWGIKDQAAALDFVVENFPDLPIHTMGHSLGGFCVPFHANADKIVEHMGVNSGPAYLYAHPPSFIWKAFSLWYLVGPLAAYLFGYLPGKQIGLNADIPSTVYWQWRRWCINERFHEVDWGTRMPMPDLKRFKGKLRLISLADDFTIPSERVKELKRFFPAANSEFKLVDPADYGGGPIGHIAIFSKRNQAAWAALL